jgi:hypothetical protein
MHDDLKLQSSRSKKSPAVKNQVKDGTNAAFPFYITLPESLLLNLCTGVIVPIVFEKHKNIKC